MKRFILISFILGHGFYLLTSSSIVKTTSKNAETHYINPYKMIAEGKDLLRDGDLVVRLNIEPSSEVIRQFNRIDKSYSHAGIVLFDNGIPFVYHIVNGCENPDEKLRKDSLSRFCDPRRNLAFGIYRYDLTATEILNLKAIIHKWYKLGVKFDYRFDLKTNDKMYCSEMVSKALATSTLNRIIVETTKTTAIEARFFSAYAHLSYPYTSNLKIVAIDNLYQHQSCYLVKKYNYKRSQ